LILIAFAAAGCSRSSSESDSLTHRVGVDVEDALGRKFVFDQPPVRVVTIAPGATEVVAAAGGARSLVGISNVDSYPPEVLSLPTFSVLPLDIETITSLDPDLVFASNQINDPEDIDVFSALNIPVFYLDASSWDAVHNSILTVGVILDTGSTATARHDSLTTRIEHLKGLTEQLETLPEGIFLISDVTSWSFGPGSYVQDIFKWAGIATLTDSYDTPAPILSDEFVLLSDPDIILGTFGDDFTPDDILKHHPTWKTLSAYKNGRIYSVEADLILRPGPRNVLAAYQLAEFAHPQLFTALDEGH
jgi:iron complex transport system substrate-binding protein